MTSIRVARRQRAEGLTLQTLQNLEGDWISAFNLAQLAGQRWQSTARALARMVAHGSVRKSLLYWRDKGYRPRVTTIYQAAPVEPDTTVWPAWMWQVPQRNRGAPGRPPKLPRERS